MVFCFGGKENGLERNSGYAQQERSAISCGYSVLQAPIGFITAIRYWVPSISFTLGLLFIGWIVDLFLIPSMDRKADLRFTSGKIDYNLAWVLLTFLGLFGIHRMYMGKWISGILYLLTGGILGIGVIYDFWTLNDQITLINSKN